MTKDKYYLRTLRKYMAFFSNAWLLNFFLSVFWYSQINSEKNFFSILEDINVQIFVLYGISISLLFVIPIVIVSWLRVREIKSGALEKYVSQKIFLTIQRVVGVSAGVAGLLIILIFILISKDLTEILEIVILISIVMYSFLQSILILFNPYALLSIVLLISAIVLPDYIFKTEVFTGKTRGVILEWLPILVLFVLPIVQKKLFLKEQINE